MKSEINGVKNETAKEQTESERLHNELAKAQREYEALELREKEVF